MVRYLAFAHWDIAVRYLCNMSRLELLREKKVLSLGELLDRRAAALGEGLRVVHCHGCFDIVHPGHIRHLRDARALGDILLVSVTADQGVSKGAARPLIPQELRAENLAALDFVDWVHIDTQPTAAALIERVRPDIYVKGREYESSSDARIVAEREAVERGGGLVVYTSGDVVFSSTALIASLEREGHPLHGCTARLRERWGVTAAGVARTIEAFRGKRVVIVGDTIVDEYVSCDALRIAGESPIPTLRPLGVRRFDGGAAVIARHVAALGAIPVLVTALPRDAESEAIKDRLSAAGVEARAVECDGTVPVKRRYLVGTQKLMKIDHAGLRPLDSRAHGTLASVAEDAAREHADACIIADFGTGVFTDAAASNICSRVRPLVGILTGDVSTTHPRVRAMRDMDAICPNESELRAAFGSRDEGLSSLAWELVRETRSKAVVVKMGPDGLIAFTRKERDEASVAPGRLDAEHVPATMPYAVDALGAGDAMMSSLTLALACGATMQESAFIGAVAAGLETQRVGNVEVHAAELRKAVGRVYEARLECVIEPNAGARGTGLRVA